MKIILASKSGVRRQILEKYKIDNFVKKLKLFTKKATKNALKN